MRFFLHRYLTAARNIPRVAITNRPALDMHLAGINVRIDHNNLSVLLGKSFALVDSGCARQNVVAARSLAVQQVAIAAHLSARTATEISRSGTLHSRRVALPLQFTLYASALHDPYPATLISFPRPIPFSFSFFYGYTLSIYLDVISWRFQSVSRNRDDKYSKKCFK